MMAGRPRTMYRKVSEMAARAAAFAEELYELMPEQYHGEQYNTRDPLCMAWRAAMTSIAQGWRQLTELGELLAVKIRKISPEDGPLTLDGETMTLAEWARLYEIPVPLVLERVKCGWDWETAIVTPPEEPSPTEAVKTSEG